ncbi:Hsp33 family molecular chaperone HslO [Thiotrichales bacterium 19S9-12]|nr:Hsp33 family molecular chaperone HslO [Thiotrichales bacterium 19S9-11]MCF6812289.1 Hsp33 family molecular chaperone HslO [Thiotrichales bacterium 19S9-12]
MNSTNNFYQSFLCEDLAIRGALIDLSNVYTKALSIHSYPESQQKLLSHALITSIFLCHNQLKNGRTLLQYQGSKNDDLITAQATSSGYVRIMLRSTDNNDSIDLSKGQLAVFYQPDDISLHQQSIVEVIDNDLIKSVEHYFSQSEQVNTNLWLFSSQNRLIGLFIQQLPSAEADYAQALEIISKLNEIDTDMDQFTETLLSLFADYQFSISKTVKLTYGCENSENRFKNAILSIGSKEAVNQMFTDKETLDVTCEFCNKTRSFDQSEALGLFN